MSPTGEPYDMPLIELDGEHKPIVAATLATLAAKLRGIAHAVGVEGSAGPLAARAIAATSKRPILYVAPDLETARRALDDIGFFTSEASGLPPLTEPAALLLAPPETSPYADIHPERQSAMARLATLFHVGKRLPFGFLVAPAASLVRRVVPLGALLGSAPHLVAEDEINLEDLVRRLSMTGYLRAPVVEDPGSFAVRGGLLDVWPPGLDAPVRAELYGDLVLSLRSFDPETQRTSGTIADAWLVPAREAILTSDVVERARATVRTLADAVNLPSVKARRLADDVAEGRQFYGGDGFLPAYYELSTLFEYIPDDAIVVVEDPARVVRAIGDELRAAEEGAARRDGSPHFPVAALFSNEDDVAPELESRATVLLHRVGVAGSARSGLSALEVVPPDTPSLSCRDLSDLERATQSARSAKGKHGVLDPLVERVTAWLDHGMKVLLTARSASQADRLATLLSHRGVAVLRDLPRTDAGDGPATDADRDLSEPAADDRAAVRVVVGPLSRGVVAPAEGLALVTEEEIFGHRAHRPAKKARAARALLEDLKRLAPGDFVVHVDHGVGRYLGLEKKHIGGVTVDLLAVEYSGGDKLFLPVHRLNQVEKYWVATDRQKSTG